MYGHFNTLLFQEVLLFPFSRVTRREENFRRNYPHTHTYTHTYDDIGIYFSTGPRLSVIDRSHR